MISTNNDFAAALFMLALENDKLSVFSADLKKIKAVFDENPDYVLLLSAPELSKQKRKQLIDEALGGKVDEYIVNFLKVLCDHKKLNRLDDCIKTFNGLKKQSENRITAHVSSAVELSEEQINGIKEKLERKLGRKVKIKSVVDKNILGGIKIEFEDKIIDGSIKKQLHDIKDVISG